MTFIGKLFEEHMLSRRCVILILLWTNYAITYITFDYVIYATCEAYTIIGEAGDI